MTSSALSGSGTLTAGGLPRTEDNPNFRELAKSRSILRASVTGLKVSQYCEQVNGSTSNHTDSSKAPFMLWSMFFRNDVNASFCLAEDSVKSPIEILVRCD